jgi:predicted lipoprotein
MAGARRFLFCLSAAGAAVLALSACKVVSIEEDRAIRERGSGSFDADHYVSQAWSVRVLPQLEASAVPISRILTTAARNLDAAGSEFGRKVGEGSPWTFVAEGEGVVRTINDESREGTIELAVPNGAAHAMILVQTGPVIVDNSLRDSLPFVSFNDFSGQLAFADVGRSLNQRALTGTRESIEALEVGDRVAFLGTLNLSGDEALPRLLPVRIAETGGEG